MWRSCGAEHALAEQGEAGAPIHAALDQLHSVHLALHLAIGPLEEQRRQHGVAITPDARGEGPQFTVAGGGEPRLERVGVVVVQHLDELPDQPAGCGQSRRLAAQRFHVGSLLGTQLGRFGVGLPE